MGLDDEIVHAAFGGGARRETIVGRQPGESRCHGRWIAAIDGKAIVAGGDAHRGWAWTNNKPTGPPRKTDPRRRSGAMKRFFMIIMSTKMRTI
jgi:hypothetical protein